jgi:hypothetical protein
MSDYSDGFFILNGKKELASIQVWNRLGSRERNAVTRTPKISSTSEKEFIATSRPGFKERVRVMFGDGAELHAIPKEHKWIFDQSEDLSPHGSKYLHFRQALIKRYIAHFNKFGKPTPKKTIQIFSQAEKDFGKHLEGRLGVLGGLSDSPFEGATPIKYLSSPYRVQVFFHDDFKTKEWDEKSYQSELAGNRIYVGDDGNWGVYGGQIEGTMKDIDLLEERLLHGNTQDYRVPARIAEYPAYTVEEAKRIYHILLEHYPDRVSILKHDRHKKLEKWAVVVRPFIDPDVTIGSTLTFDVKIIDDEDEEEFRSSLVEAIGDTNETGARWFEMHGDDAKDMFYESLSEGEVDSGSLFKTGSFMIDGDSGPVTIDFSPIPGAVSKMKSPKNGGKEFEVRSAGWSMNGELEFHEETQQPIEVLKEKEADNYEIAIGKPLHEPQWANPKTHTFEALKAATETDGKRIYELLDEFSKGLYGPKMYGDWGQSWDLSFVKGNAEVFHSNVEDLDISNFIYDETGELTHMPKYRNISWQINPDGRTGGLASTSNFEILSNRFVKAGKGGGKGKVHFSDSTFKFARTFTNSRGKKLRYQSKNAGGGLVIWKNKLNARRAAHQARELGWLIRTVNVGGGWVNLGNAARFTQAGTEQFPWKVSARQRPTYYRKR